MCQTRLNFIDKYIHIGFIDIYRHMGFIYIYKFSKEKYKRLLIIYLCIYKNNAYTLSTLKTVVIWLNYVMWPLADTLYIWVNFTISELPMWGFPSTAVELKQGIHRAMAAISIDFISRTVWNERASLCMFLVVTILDVIFKY